MSFEAAFNEKLMECLKDENRRLRGILAAITLDRPVTVKEVDVQRCMSSNDFEFVINPSPVTYELTIVTRERISSNS